MSERMMVRVGMIFVFIVMMGVMMSAGAEIVTATGYTLAAFAIMFALHKADSKFVLTPVMRQARRRNQR